MIGEEQSSLDNLNIFKEIFHFRGEIQNIMLNTEHLKLRQVPNESVKALERVCFEAGGLSGELEGGLYEILSNQLHLHDFSVVGLGFIYPGTKYCGPGETNFHFNFILNKSQNHSEAAFVTLNLQIYICTVTFIILPQRSILCSNRIREKYYLIMENWFRCNGTAAKLNRDYSTG